MYKLSLNAGRRWHATSAALVLLLTLGAPMLRGQDFCALTVHVEGPGGPINSTWIELTDSLSGKSEFKRMVGANFEICDFGFGTHTLTVGINECFPVAISNLQVMFGHPIHLRVLLNSCARGDGGSNACEVYLRVSDQSGQPAQGAAVKGVSAGGFALTDSYGRSNGVLLNGKDDDLVVTLAGHTSTTAHVACRDSKQVNAAVVLTAQ